LVRRCERYVAETILPKEGFTDILLVSSIRSQFPVDILARKDDLMCAIEVTLQPSKKLRNLSELFSFLGIKKRYVCHITYTLDKYFLLERPIDATHSSCMGLLP
jgi:hypothetical protein